jgi:hypothetical protein
MLTISIWFTNNKIKTPSLINKLTLLLLGLRLNLLKNCLTIKNYSFNTCFKPYSALLSRR